MDIAAQNIYDFKYDQIDLSDPKGVVALFERKNVELMGSAGKRSRSIDDVED